MRSCGLILVFFISCTEQVTWRPPSLTSQGSDCAHIKANTPQASSGVYVIQPHGVKQPFKVYCEMRADGAWMVFQHRSGAQVSFNKKWEPYKNGFGKPTGDHWLGLKRIRALTKDQSRRWTLRVDLWDHSGATAFAQYNNFRLGSENAAFKLHVGKYTGDAGDAIRQGSDQNGFGFSTWDRDNDGCSPCIFGDIAQKECASAVGGGGGWWYSRCGSAALNGDWHQDGNHVGWASGLHWSTWKGPAPYSMKATRMMVKAA